MRKKIFNVAGRCCQDRHYMVELTGRLQVIRRMVDAGQYFTINRARQYGKTTILQALKDYLQEDYLVISLDFQMLSYADFENEQSFTAAFSRELLEEIGDMPDKIQNRLTGFADRRVEHATLSVLFQCLTEWCRTSVRSLVLMIDEVDSAANNQVFMDFLAQLRGAYIRRDRRKTFQSVILAGVYDVKNISQKIRPEEEHKTNSPWNIAADFLVDLSFSAEDIAGMLETYEEDHRTGMKIREMSEWIYAYTSGYPYLVSRICKLLDERVAESPEFSAPGQAWTKEGFLKAVRILLSEPNAVFDSMINKLEDYPELEEMLRDLLFRGKEITYVLGVRPVEMALMFGFVTRADNRVVIANRIFETLLYNLFLASPAMQQQEIYDAALKDRNQFVKDGRLDMRCILERFVLHFTDLYGDQGQRFYEEDGRRYFMLFLKPIINGTGNCYVEAETRNRERTDLVVDYLGEQFVLEIKIWYGNAYHTRGEKQLSDYLDYYHLETGYMLSFNFNKKKETGIKEIRLGRKRLIEAVV